MNLYQMYLTADMISRRLERIGAKTAYMMITDDVKAAIGYYSTDGKWLSDTGREELAATFLNAFPESTLDRSTPRYASRPQMTISGVTNLGIQWEIDFGTGVCERVQVGTKKVEQYDPAQLAKLTKVVVDEPVYEYRCPDPIVAAGLVAS